MATFYYIGILDQDENLVSVFNGTEYVDNTEDIKLYPKYRKTNALQEAGRHQSLNCPIGYEVKLFPVNAETPIIQRAETVKTPEEIDKAVPVLVAKQPNT